MKLTPEQIKFRESTREEPEQLTVPSEEIKKILEEMIEEMSKEPYHLTSNHDTEISNTFFEKQ